MKVTIRDVAKHAGVSTASVSLVLNNKPVRIGEDARKRILDSAKELGYNQEIKKVASNFKSFNKIGVIRPDFSNDLVNQCIRGIENYASIYGHKIVISNVSGSTERCIEYIGFLAELGVEGIIVIPPMDMNTNGNNAKLKNSFKNTNIPFVLLDRAIDNVFCDFITSDNKQGAYMATEYMIQNGHRDIGMIAGTSGVYNTRKRIQGYKEALAFYNLPIVEENIYYGDYEEKDGYMAAEYFCAKGIEAIFAAGDEMALGVYDYAIEKGLVIGEDISIVGFDDSAICKRLTPPLTSIVQLGEMMGKKACEMVVRRIIKEQNEEVRNTYFSPRIEERSSVKKLK